MLKKLFKKKVKSTKKEKKKFSKMIVPLVIMLNVLFAVGVLYVFLQTSNEPTALVAGWFAFTTGELWMLSGIKKAEVKAKSDINNDNDEIIDEEEFNENMEDE